MNKLDRDITSIGNIGPRLKITNKHEICLREKKWEKCENRTCRHKLRGGGNPALRERQRPAPQKADRFKLYT